MKKVAITGNIGSGKSWVCALFQYHFGIPVYNSDVAAKQLYFLPSIREQLTQRFGERIYLSEDTLDRRYIADLIFHDEKAQQDLEGILYPALFVDFQQWTNRQDAPYVLFESALVFEKHIETRFDAVVMVTASEETRLRRAMQRDRCEEATIRARMARQWPDATKCFLADFVILHEKDDEDETLLEQIAHLNALL